jgi:hypothetical protein
MVSVREEKERATYLVAVSLIEITCFLINPPVYNRFLNVLARVTFYLLFMFAFYSKRDYRG